LHHPSQQKLLTHQHHHLTSLIAHLVLVPLSLMRMVMTNYVAEMVAACVAPQVRKGQLAHRLQQQVLGQLREQGQVQAWGLDQGLAGSLHR